MLDVNTTLTELHKTLCRLIGEDIHLILKTNAAPARIRIDPTQLEQVVFNLSVNARDAMPGGGDLVFETANFTVDEAFARSHPGTAPGAYVQLSVSDSGIGMDGRTISQIFEPFFTTKGQDKGTGLGLAMVYGIVRQAGGAITVYSEPGVGSAFKIYLPVADAPEKGPVVEAVQDIPLSGKETVLVVEDESLVRKALAALLEAQGYRVVTFDSGTVALERFATLEPRADLVITDMIMPGMNGRILEQRLKTIDPKVRVLLMSGHSDDFFGRDREIG